jgi:hypothetical protein
MPGNADDATRSLLPRKRTTGPVPRPIEPGEEWEERLLGFDARVPAPTDWPAERRARHLLRLDVVQPCSADAQVWPSLFDRPGHVRPSYVGFFQELWEDLEHLRQHVPRGASPDLMLVAVTVQTRKGGWTGESPLAPVLGGRVFDAFSGLPLPLPYARPSSRDPAWPLIGYDVATTAGVTGLARCGDGVEFDQDELRAKHGARLNSRHLFDDATEAEEFRWQCDKREPVRSPFFVYGLWRVPEKTTTKPPPAP